MRALLTLAILCLAATAPAQDPAPAPAPTPPADIPEPLRQATGRLQRALATTGNLPNCAFTAEWGPKDQAGQKPDPRLQMLGGVAAHQSAKGVWSRELLHVVFDTDELLFAGRETLAKDATTGWTRRARRFVDGNLVAFAPDPARLLAALAALDLVVVHREVASLDDRPVEIATVTLSPDDQANLLWAGLLPEPTAGVFQVFLGGNGAGARAAAPKPEGTLDIAFHLDPATGHLHRVHLRSNRPDQFGAGRFVMLGGGAGRVRIAGNALAATDDEDEDEAADAAEPAADAPPTYENGLPVRPRKKMLVEDFVLDFANHGSAQLPALDAAAQRLLGGR